MADPRLSAVVVTLGLSPWLRESLAALRAGDEPLEVVLVDQGLEPLGEAVTGLADRTVRLASNRGFAEANNRGLAVARGRFLATVNDDAIVAPEWAGRLLTALEADPRAGAAQGLNLTLEPPSRVDGRGLGWNRRWQAVQLGRGRQAPPDAERAGAGEVAQEVFGVSATAAIYRRQALERLGRPFDPRLGSYYEDVDLACRLRAAGYRALLVPAARARHAGGTSGRTLARRGVPLIYGNRYLVLARVLGRAFWPRLPVFWLRDVADLAHACRRRQLGTAAGIVAGWGRALRLLPRFARFGAPTLRPAELLGTAA